MEWLVEIISNNNVHIDAGEINLPIKDVYMSKLYTITGNLTKKNIQKSIDLLFKDKITEKHKIYKIKSGENKKASSSKLKSGKWEVEVFYKKEVTDPSTSYILKALIDIRIKALNVRTGFRYVINGNLNLDEVKLFSKRYLANLIIQDMYIKSLE